MRPLVFVLPLLVVGLLGCADEAPPPPTPAETAATDTSHAVQQVLTEEQIQLVAVRGDLMRRDAEVSGMEWYDDRLVLLPQHPRRFSSCGGEGCLFTITRQAIERALSQASPDALEPEGMALVTNGVEERLPGFEGYEAIAFHGDQAFLAIETRTLDGMRGYAVRGRMADGGRRLILEAETLVELPHQVDVDNMSYESIVWNGDRLLALHEANGANVNPYPKVFAFDEQLQPLDTVRFSAVEYRITDATAPDRDGRFWVVNYFYPGEEDLLDPALDSVQAQYGDGETHGRSRTVERLVPLRLGADRVERVDHPPILLRLADGVSRNWEGIAHLRGQGFLLVTDTYPETMLAFVPHADQQTASR